jgi:hypothetical protein
MGPNGLPGTLKTNSTPNFSKYSMIRSLQVLSIIATQSLFFLKNLYFNIDALYLHAKDAKEAMMHGILTN